MKKIVILMSVMTLLLVSNQSIGQKKVANPAKKAQRQTEWMTKELGLLADQATKVGEINTKYIAAIDEAENTIANKAERVTKVRNLQKERNEELKKVLSPEQFSKLQELLKEKKEQRKANKN